MGAKNPILHTELHKNKLPAMGLTGVCSAGFVGRNSPKVTVSGGAVMASTAVTSEETKDDFRE